VLRFRLSPLSQLLNMCCLCISSLGGIVLNEYNEDTLRRFFMVYDKNLAALFLLNFKESYRSAKLLVASRQRIEKLIPLSTSKMKNLSIDDLDMLDAFRVRFCDLQDSLGSKTFRSLLKLEEEDSETQLDIINKMDKRKIISSFQEWKKLREIRNLFSHDYPDSDELRAESLNIAHANSLQLINTLDNLKAYIEKHLKISLESFPFLNRNQEN
jgi:hypothetical protein